MEPDEELCLCHHVTKRKIVNFLKRVRPSRASQANGCFDAGSGCGWCIPFLIKLHRQVLAGENVCDGLSPGEYAALRAEYVSGVARGAREKNRHAGPEEALPPQPRPPDKGIPSEPFDCTSYFSRSRPDPEPETLT
jgi:bacterioferritin-associated ferredoxin